jgi:plastocyanin
MPSASSSSNKINITDFSFIAPVITVAKGTTVTWTNYDNMAHKIEADDNSFASSNLNIGNSYSHTFNNTGALTYHCKAHTGMSGSVIVK